MPCIDRPSQTRTPSRGWHHDATDGATAHLAAAAAAAVVVVVGGY
jgi:hypothetical protein